MAKSVQKASFSREQQRVVARVQELYRKRRPLNISAVRESHPDVLLAAYTATPFLGWRRGIEGAGLDYSRIKVRVPSTIKCRICGAKRKKLDQHIVHHHKMSVEEYRVRYRASILSAPSVRSLKKDSRSLLLPHWEPHWSPEYVLDRLYAFHEMGIPLNPSNVEKGEIVTYRVALGFFKNWDVVLQALQLDPKEVRKAARKKAWTRTTLLREVRRRKVLGQDVNWTSMLELDRSVTWAAVKLFGSYDRMLRSAGLDPKAIRKKPRAKNRYRTESDIINGICRRRLRDFPINSSGVTKGERRDLSLYNRARRVFGTWADAVKAAGFDYDKVSLLGNPYRTKKRVIAEIKRRHSEGMSLTAKDVRYGSSKDGQLYTSALEFFRSWSAALKKAGVAVEDVYPSKAKYVSKDDVISAIQKRDKKGLGTGSGAVCHGAESDVALFMRARRLFDGGWKEAVTASGFDYSSKKGPSRKYPSAKRIVGQIKKRKKLGLPLNATAVASGKDSDSALYRSARKEFGSWQKATEAAGLKYENVTVASTYPTAESILGEIRRRHSSGLLLNSKEITKGDQRNPALHARCVKVFGGWKQAVEAAGISYASVRLPRAKYETAAAVLAEIRRRHQAGLRLTYNAVEREEGSDRPLMLAAGRVYGSWQKAVRAAGLAGVLKEETAKSRRKKQVEAFAKRVRDANDLGKEWKVEFLVDLLGLGTRERNSLLYHFQTEEKDRASLSELLDLLISPDIGPGMYPYKALPIAGLRNMGARSVVSVFQKISGLDLCTAFSSEWSKRRASLGRFVDREKSAEIKKIALLMKTGTSTLLRA